MLPRARRRTRGEPRAVDGDLLLSSRQAADRLGVKLETLYAYVARGLLHGVAKNGAGAPGRRYSERELEGFQARRRWNRRVVTSALSSTDGGRLLYRGHDAVALAEEASFEQVASLLWTGQPGVAHEWPEVDGATIEPAVRAARAVPGATPPVHALIVVPALGSADGARGARDASTGADPYAVVTTGLATLGGPKHGGMTDLVDAAFRARRAADEEAPLGFGHPLYPDGDPRTPPLLAAARAGVEPGSLLEAALAEIDAMAARGRPAPTLDVGLAATSLALGLAPGLASMLFALGRTVGWVAHAIEQYGMGELIPPRARYVGPGPEGG